jgi:hypothetical protein
MQTQMMAERGKYCHYYSKNHLGVYIFFIGMEVDIVSRLLAKYADVASFL